LKKKINLSYNNRVISKPWGEEYVIFKNKKKIALTYLKIKKGFSTSLHCHPLKKTGFLILKGIAKVQVGIYKKNIVKYPPMSILVLRPGLFHRIKANNSTDLYALELESPYLKNDLIRMEDKYGRSNKGYEKLKNSRKILKKDVLFKFPTLHKKNYYNLNNIKIEIGYHRDLNKFKSYDDKSVSIILDGKIVSKKNKTVITTGEIVKSFTLKQLTERFKISEKLLVLKASKL
tara:strand:- start:3989 stop:4684 length:696 start_codon:yes stop_codon:yes gene_type:complete